MSIRTIFLGVLLALSGIFSSAAANAQGPHASYLKARADLQVALGALQQYLDGKAMTHNEKEALRQIYETIREINEANIDNGKDAGALPKVQPGKDDAARISQCVIFLAKAKDDLGYEADSQFANGLRDRSIRNCEAAISFVKRGHEAQLHN